MKVFCLILSHGELPRSIVNLNRLFSRYRHINQQEALSKSTSPVQKRNFSGQTKAILENEIEFFVIYSIEM